MFNFNQIDFILKGLNRLITRLQKVADAHDKKVAAHEKRIARLENKKVVSLQEAARARHIAHNFKQLVAPPALTEPSENPDSNNA